MIVRIYYQGNKRISALYGGREYDLRGGQPAYIKTEETAPVIQVKNYEKNIVTINWIDLFLQILAGDGSYCVARCSYSFTLKGEKDCVITLKDLSASKGEYIMFSSVYAQTDNGVIENERYQINNPRKIIKKHRLLHILLLSGLPLLTALVIVTLLFLEGVGMWIAIFLFSCVFTIPSFSAVAKFKKYMNDDFASERLLAEAIFQKHPEEYQFEGKKSRFAKCVEKILSKMFNIKD